VDSYSGSLDWARAQTRSAKKARTTCWKERILKLLLDWYWVRYATGANELSSQSSVGEGMTMMVRQVSR
jgi:hypothetical protein